MKLSPLTLALTFAERRERYMTRWKNSLYTASKDLFPGFSETMRNRWVNAKIYIGTTLPKVNIGGKYGKI